ncbi:hypothetical protein Gorai_008381, partial [Gossypium raimondii]|nr:hypothetical protein [Gossypium raimondii]
AIYIRVTQNFVAGSASASEQLSPESEIQKTVAEGRRISLAKACENPTCVEIADCCNHLKVPNAIE